MHLASQEMANVKDSHMSDSEHGTCKTVTCKTATMAYARRSRPDAGRACLPSQRMRLSYMCHLQRAQWCRTYGVQVYGLGSGPYARGPVVMLGVGRFFMSEVPLCATLVRYPATLPWFPTIYIYIYIYMNMYTRGSPAFGTWRFAWLRSERRASSLFSARLRSPTASV